MTRPLSGSLALLFTFIALALAQRASAQTVTASDKRLADFVELNQYASPYRGASVVEQWCYYARADRGYSPWYLEDWTAGLIAVQAQNGFGIPFASGAYSSAGALVVGYVVDGGLPTADLDPVSYTANAPACATGTRILADGPFPVVSLARNLGAQTAIDPAHEYRRWPMKGSYHRVRMIASIPAAFQVGNGQLAGKIVLGFTSDW